MNIGDALYSFLTNQIALTGLVDDRIYPFAIPQGKDPPAITYQQISRTPVRTHQGEDDLKRPIFSFSCWGNSIEEAWEIAAALQAEFATVSTMGSYTIQNIPQVGENEDEEISSDGTIKKYRVILDFQIFYK